MLKQDTEDNLREKVLLFLRRFERILHSKTIVCCYKKKRAVRKQRFYKIEEKNLKELQ